MNKEEKRIYMRQYMQNRREGERRQKDLHNARVSRYRKNHAEQTKEYDRQRKAEWRKRLAVLRAAGAYIADSDKTVAEQYEAYVRLNQAADALKTEIRKES